MKFGGCRQLADVRELGRGLGALSQLQHLMMNFSGCLQLADVGELGRGLARCRSCSTS